MRQQVPVALLATACVLAAVPPGTVAGTATVESPASPGVPSVGSGPVAGVSAAGVPVAGVSATGVPVAGVSATGVPATGVPAAGVPSGGEYPPAGPAAGGAVPVGADSTQDADPPPDPESDRLGWENGVWYNESIDVNASDGLTREESARLLDRTMARVELVREMEFEEPVDLNFRNRSEVAPLLTPGEAAISSSIVNTQLEALGFAGENRSGVDVFTEAQGGSAAAFVVSQPVPQLDLQAGDITIVMDEGQTAYSEAVLAHELVHVLQFQELEISVPSTGSSTDRVNANRAVIEGEASHVGYRYLQRCAEEWDCVTPQTAGPDRSPAATAMVYTSLVRYTGGGQLVAQRYDAGGWDEVTRLYARPPLSSEQLIHPAKYRTDDPQFVSVPDRSGEDWQQLSAGADTFGEAVMFLMLWYPSFESGSDVVMDPSRVNRSIRSQIQFDFGHPATAGWDGDRFVPYVSDSAAENESAYVWKSAWDSESEAAEFREAYVRVLEYRGAEPVGDDGTSFRIPDGREFGDAFAVVQNGSSVRIVNAPTVTELSAVHDGAGPDGDVTTPTPVETETATATPTPTETVTPTETATPTETVAPTATVTGSATATSGTASRSPLPTESSTPVVTDSPTATAPTTTDGDGPGFGVWVAVLSLAVLAVRSRRGRE